MPYIYTTKCLQNYSVQVEGVIGAYYAREGEQGSVGDIKYCCHCHSMQTLVFCETKRKTDELTRILRREG